MRPSIAAVCVSLAVVAAGCGSSEPDAAPDSPATTTATRAGSPSPTTPSVTPATGPVVNGVQITFRVPTGWTEVPAEADYERSFQGPHLAGYGLLFENLSFMDETKGTPKALAYMVRLTEEDADPSMHWRRLPDVTIAGMRFYHLTAARSKDFTQDEYGTLLKKRQIVFDMTWPIHKVSPAQRDELTDQIFATVRVK